MEINFNVVHVLMWFGILQGVFLGVYFLFRYPNNQCSVLFSLLLVSFVVYGIVFIARDIFESNVIPVVFMPLAIGPFFWGYTRKFKGGELRLWTFLVHLAPFFLVNALLLFLYFFRFGTQFFNELSMWLPWLEVFVFLFWIFYFFFAYKELAQLKELLKISKYSWVRNWVISLITLFSLYSIIWACYILIDWGFYELSMTTKEYYFGSICITLILYFLSTYRLSISETVRIASGRSRSIPELAMGNQSEGEKILWYFQKHKPYLDDKLNLESLSEEMGLSPREVSHTINSQFNSHFNDFINQYRIDEVKVKLADPSLNHYTSWGIGMDAGFNSKSVYYSVFKKATGISPAKYRKEIQKKIPES